MEDFNIALLDKQGWRLIKYLNSLMARVIKAKYYRRTDFLHARSYSTSSYAWRSVLQAQQLLKKWLKWNVGNGKTINVWSDNWIRSKPSASSEGIGAVTHPQIKVNDLFIHEIMSGIGRW